MSDAVESARVEYVVGFAFDWHGRVALIEKNRPRWQAGRLNGIGGHIEADEFPEDAMTREFYEETGTILTAWDHIVTMDFPGARIYFYRLLDLDPRTLDNLRTTTDEVIRVHWAYSIGSLPDDSLIPNLTWLIPLAKYAADTYEVIHVQASMAEVIDAPESHTSTGQSHPAPRSTDAGEAR